MRRSLSASAFALLLIVACPVQAQDAAQARPVAEWWGNVNIGSHHFGDEDEFLADGESFNEFNPGVGVEVQWQPAHAVSAGYFLNSLDEDSVYLMYHFTPLALGRHVRVGGMAGVVTGYPGYHGGDAAPAGGFVAKIEGDRFGANLILLPPLEDVTPATLGLQLKYRFR